MPPPSYAVVSNGGFQTKPNQLGLKPTNADRDFHRELCDMMRQSLRISERIQQEVSELRSDLATLDANLQDFKRSTINKIEQIDSSIADIGSVSKASTMICFRCHGYVVEYIQLQCGHLFCLHCVHISFMPDSKIQERTAEALREVATKRKCPTCGERRIDVNIIKKKYRV